MLGQTTTLPIPPPDHHNLHPGQGPRGQGPMQVDGIRGWGWRGDSTPSAWPLHAGCWECVNKWFTNETGWATHDQAPLSVIDEWHQGQFQPFSCCFWWCNLCVSIAMLPPVVLCIINICMISVWPNYRRTWFHKTAPLSDNMSEWVKAVSVEYTPNNQLIKQLIMLSTKCQLWKILFTISQSWHLHIACFVQRTVTKLKNIQLTLTYIRKCSYLESENQWKMQFCFMNAFVFVSWSSIWLKEIIVSVLSAALKSFSVWKKCAISKTKVTWCYLLCSVGQIANKSSFWYTDPAVFPTVKCREVKCEVLFPEPCLFFWHFHLKVYLQW